MGGWEQHHPGTAGGGAPAVHLKKTVKLVLYPGEATVDGVIVGHIYVVGGKGEAYEVAAGPKGQGAKGAGGHSAGETPAGSYILGPQEHHTTLNWPMSTIPWGAKLEKKADGFVYYSIDGGPWQKVTGPSGVMTTAGGMFFDRTWELTPAKKKGKDKAKLRQEFIESCYSGLYDDANKLLPVWQANDFGKWAWNLTKGGSRSAYYIHTTPDEELGTSKALPQSHGCVHVWPRDRDEMIARGYLKKGAEFLVKKYDLVGPP